MPGLFIQRHAEVTAGFTKVSLLYLRAVPDKPFAPEFDFSEIRSVSTLIVYYGIPKSGILSQLKLSAAISFIRAFLLGYSFLLKACGKPDLIHVNVLTRMGLAALWLKLVHRIPYVITEHWSRYLPITGTYRGIARKMATRLVVANAAAVSTVSENLAGAMQSHGLRNPHYRVLPNVADDSFYVPGKAASQGIMQFIHVSCFEDRSKNISGILRTLHELRKIRDDFRFVMVGEGIDLEKMKTLAVRLGLTEPQLRFTGLLENEALLAEYQSAGCMVMFSNYENMPVVISESFCCGIPVVATSVGGIPEYVNDSNGILVDAGDEEALLRALLSVLDHPGRFNREAIRQQGAGIFGKDAVAAKLRELYALAGFEAGSSHHPSATQPTI
jgi:glycosyltransferase involved in cell wall biosynthesis